MIDITLNPRDNLFYWYIIDKLVISRLFDYDMSFWMSRFILEERSNFEYYAKAVNGFFYGCYKW